MLGAGGMGVVYQAWDAELGVAVALKVIRPEVNADPYTAREVERRFKRELLLARQVTHKHVVRIHDLGEIDGIKYLTMPYIEGRDLAHVLRELGRLPVPQALRFAKQIADGLVAAHEAGVVHRDLKPENVMIDGENQAQIMDFGISRSVSGPATGTATAVGAVIGTLEYMAPEQARGVAVDHRADIYSFGLILHDMLAGRRRLSTSESALAEMMGRMQQAPPPLRTLAPEVPEDLDRIVSRCLQPDPDLRYAKTAELVADLNALDADGRRVRAKTPTTQARWKTATAALLVLLLAVGGGAVWLWRQRGPQVQTAAAAREPVSVLIADFDNRAGDPVFEGSLEQALAIAMEGSSFVTVYPQRGARTLAAQLAPASGGRVTADVGRLISRREGIKVLVSGTILQAGSGYELTIRASDPANGSEIVNARRSVSSKGEVLQAVAALAEKVRRGLGESRTEMANVAAAETFTAGSIEAMRAYARGQSLTHEGKYQEALASMQEALSHDPEMGRAYAGMAAIYVNLKQNDRAEASFQQAMKHLDRMSDREKYRTLATYYLGVAGNYEKGIENYEALLKAFPADNVSYGNLAFAYVRVGNVARAREVARRGLEIYPRNLLQRTNYAAYSVYAGDFETASREAERVLAENPQYEFAYLPLALSKAGQGDVAGARAAYDRLAKVSDTGRSLAALGQADLDLFGGRLDRAEQTLRDGLALDERLDNPGEAAIKRLVLSETELAGGRQRPAVADARGAAAATALVNVEVPAALLLIESGQLDAARAIARDLDARLQNQTSAYSRLILAAIAIKEHKLPEAAELLRDAIKRQDLWLARFELGRAYFEAGHGQEALDEWQRCYTRRGEVMDVFFADSPTTRYLPPLYYWLGRAHESVGAMTSAANAYRDYIKARGEAPKDPLLADAQRRLASVH